ncbi:hypothetical protein DHEL01_v210172 [Diaporthe helianthi]|uniref:Aminotransferase class I/classII large domain-containing protein n=1 Tax=Diaporthe helianthi TaxID=158607 RepID=A0A2P5HMG7_DIAHE|nr:hypothetical protein DHEL01_v210172 [Diaporthe helianthi]
MGKINAAVEERANESSSSTIDLGTAENWLMRAELMQISKTAIRGKLAAKDLSYQDGFAGHSALLTALAAMFNQYFFPVIPVTPSHLAIAPGGAASLDALLYNICEHGDGVLVPGPFWNGFDWLLSVRSGVVPVLVNVENLKDTFTTALIPRLAQALKESSRPIKALLLTNPHNPFGQCYPRAVIEKCIQFCQQHNIHYISDEVYGLSGFPSPTVKDPVPFTSALAVDIAGLGCDPWRVHVVWSMSKDFGSSGFRMVSSLTAICATALLTSPSLSSLLQRNASRLAEAYGKLVDFFMLHDIEYLPVSHGPFVFARIAGRHLTSWDEETEAIQCFKDAGVVLSPGKAYHMNEHEKGWSRITFAVVPQQLDAALSRLETGLERWSLIVSNKAKQQENGKSGHKRRRSVRTQIGAKRAHIAAHETATA